MANRMKELQRMAKSYENRWKSAMQVNNVIESNIATIDYEENIKKQEEILQHMDPNSKDYEKAQMTIDQQKSNLWDMKYEQNHQYGNNQKISELEKCQAKNEALAKSMEKAIDRGDTKTYESLRNQYSKNIEAQKQVGNQLKSDNCQFNDKTESQMRDRYNMDIDMRNKLSEKMGKNPSESQQKEMNNAVKNMNESEKQLLAKQQERTQQNSNNQEQSNSKENSNSQSASQESSNQATQSASSSRSK